MERNRRAVTCVVRGVVLAALLLATAIAPAMAAGQLRVTICHATRSATNPYNLITVAVSAIDGSRANDHSSHPRDIIPPVNGLPGWNWDARGQAVFAAGCSTVVLADTDGDGRRDVVDPDDDGDGIPDAVDPDDDGDGVSDDRDPDQAVKTDTDGDGVVDAVDPDDDGDGIRDRFDPDDDGDGLPDVADQDRPGYTDLDNDCIPDRDDADDNNDGVFEIEPTEGVAKNSPLHRSTAVAAQTPACTPGDTDRDGFIDGADSDDNGDGKPDQFTTDADRDRIPDYRDTDDDEDGIPDARDSDDDGDGIVETVPQVVVDMAPATLVAEDGVAVLLRDAAVLTDSGQRAAVTITCRVTSMLRSAPKFTPMDAEGPADAMPAQPGTSSKKACRIVRRAGSLVAVVTPGTAAVATIRYRAPAVGDRLPIDVIQRVRITG